MFKLTYSIGPDVNELVIQNGKGRIGKYLDESETGVLRYSIILIQPDIEALIDYVHKQFCDYYDVFKKPDYPKVKHEENPF